VRKHVGGAWLCLALFCALFAVPCLELSAQPNASVPSISERLTSLKANLVRLENAWKQQKIALSEARRLSTELQAELSEVRQSLQTSQMSLATSRLALAKSMTSLRQSETTLSELQTSFQAYRQQARRRVVIGWLAGGLGIVAGILIAIVF